MFGNKCFICTYLLEESLGVGSLEVELDAVLFPGATNVPMFFRKWLL